VLRCTWCRPSPLDARDACRFYKPSYPLLANPAPLSAELSVNARSGARIERVMTDNGKVFTSNACQAALIEIGARHILTPPSTPQWNGEAERFIETILREWAYAIAYRTSDERYLALPAWLRYDNEERQDSALNYRSPNLRSRKNGQQPV